MALYIGNRHYFSGSFTLHGGASTNAGYLSDGGPGSAYIEDYRDNIIYRYLT